MSFLDPKALTSDGLRTFTKWTRKDLALLRKRYASTPNSTLARLIGKTKKSITTKACHLGLKKSKRRLTQMGRENVKKRKHWPKSYRRKA